MFFKTDMRFTNNNFFFGKLYQSKLRFNDFYRYQTQFFLLTAHLIHWTLNPRTLRTIKYISFPFFVWILHKGCGTF